MLSIGVTGGAASGKSTAARRVASALGIPHHSADEIVADLLRDDPRVHLALTQRFGDSIVTQSGIDRAMLRERVFTSDTERKFLETLLHPLVRESWLGALRVDRAAGRPFFLVEIPLLFEVGAQSALDFVLCVACTPAVQMDRMTRLRKVSPEIAAGILSAQWNNEQRMEAADLVIWNDGSLDSLHQQCHLAINMLTSRQENVSPS